MTMNVRLGMFALLAGSTLATTAHAQDAPMVYNARPETTRTSCEPQEVYDLVAVNAASPYRATSSTAPGGFDPAAETALCGSVTRAQPLTCMTSTGTKAKDAAACDATARKTYETRNRTTVYRAPGTAFEYYTAETRLVGAVPLADTVRLSGDIYDGCLQITELEIYSNGTNVALASRGAVVSATPPYDSTSGAVFANDGSMSGMYHSTCSGGNYLSIKLPSPVRIERIVVYGRSGEWGRRDLYKYQVMNGSSVEASGQIDARNKTGSAQLGGLCQAQTFEWQSVAGPCEGGQTRNVVTCNDTGSGLAVDASRCNASMRPPAFGTCSTQTAVTPKPPVVSIPEVQVGWCGYTSSGGGRYACGPFEDGSAKAAFAASWPYPSDLCTGREIRSATTAMAGGKNWTISPLTQPVAGARCVIHMKSGYSGHKSSDRPTWESHYYDGPPTGNPGGTFINKKP